MTAKSFAPLIGSVGIIEVEQLFIPVQILDAKQAWGQNRLLIRPTHGQGEKWVDASRVKLIQKEAQSV